jgi:hypothetical protein
MANEARDPMTHEMIIKMSDEPKVWHKHFDEPGVYWYTEKALGQALFYEPVLVFWCPTTQVIEILYHTGAIGEHAGEIDGRFRLAPPYKMNHSPRLAMISSLPPSLAELGASEYIDSIGVTRPLSSATTYGWV